MPAQPPKTAIIPLKNKGFISKIDPKDIEPGAFQYIENIMSEVEGSITCRRGRQVLGTSPDTADSPTFAYKCVIGPGEPPANAITPQAPSLNLRYIQQDSNIYRTRTYATSSFTQVATGVCTGPTTSALSTFWSEANYDTGPTGAPWAFFACQNGMFKDYGTTPFTGTGNSGPNIFTNNGTTNALQYWGIQPANGGVELVANGSPGVGAGNLNGGAVGSPAGSLPYSYVFCYANPSTGNQGNPSQIQLSDTTVANGAPLGVNEQSITITIYGGTSDPQIPTSGTVQSLAIYRAGGTFADGLYRFVGYTTAPSYGGSPSTFVDNNSDTAIAAASQVFYDNNPPITSSLSTPIITTISANPGGVGQQNVTLVSAAGLTVGSTVVISSGPSNSTQTEYVIIGDISGNTIGVYLQYAHLAGDVVTCSVITGAPASLTCYAFDAIWVAGDPNNPHVLYYSKTGLPESFPIIDALGNSHSLNVGSPSNPIVNICEFRGNLVCLNSQSIYEVPVFDGVAYAPNITPAQRGLFAQKAFCITDSEIWYLSYDGIYSWGGSQSAKRSEAIDQIFHGIETPDTPSAWSATYPGSFVPINFSPYYLQFARMEYYRGQVHFLYIDINGVTNEIYYDTVYQRWIPNIKNVTGNPQTGMLVEKDTGNFIYMRQGGVFCLDDIVDGNGLTSDEFTGGTGSNGTAITAVANSGWLDLGNQYIPKIFDEIWLDIDIEKTLSNSNLINVYYDYNFSTAFDQFMVYVGGIGRQWVPLSLNLLSDTNQPGNSYSTFARQASVICLQFALSTAVGIRATVYGVKFKYRELSDLVAAPYYDWDDCGHPYDKRFYELTVEFDTNIWPYNPGIGSSTPGHASHTLVLDTLSGVSGNTYTLATQVFQIDNTVTSIISPGRGLATLPINDLVIAKMVRLRFDPLQMGMAPDYPSANYFRIISVSFKKEDFPPDIVPFCEWQDNGNPHFKYLNEIQFDVDTNGQTVNVRIQADNVTVQQVAINTTDETRDVTILITPSQGGVSTGYVMGRKWRWQVIPATDIPSGGKFQVFSSRFVFQAADKGDSTHTLDWDDLGHPYDKLLQTVVIEYDNQFNASPGSAVTVQLDTINGVSTSQQVNTNVQSFTLSNAVFGRGKAEFAIAAASNALQVAKMIRLYPTPTSISTGFRIWKYAFTKVDYPPDSIYVTEWRLAQSPTDKEPTWLYLDMDTNGTNASVVLQNETGNILTVTHNGTVTNRVFNYPIHLSETSSPFSYSKMWRLVITQASSNGAKTQMFSWGFQRWEPIALSAPADPPDSILFTPWTDFGYPYQKLARNFIITVDTESGTWNVNLQADGATVQTFQITTTFTNRRVVLACNSNLSGILWRLTFSPVSSATIDRLWDWSLDYIKQPAAVTLVDTYWQDFGFPGWKWIKDCWLRYQTSSGGSVTCTIYIDGGVQYYQFTMPTNLNNDLIRFFIPNVFGGNCVKSKTYRFIFSAVSGTFQLYGESRFDWLPWNASQRESFRQYKVTSEQQLSIT